MNNLHPVQFTPIGEVRNDFNESTLPDNIKSRPSRVVIYPEYAEAFLHIEECRYLDIVYYFNQLEGESVKLSGLNIFGAERGVFASRTPKRPNLIGVTTVELLELHDTELLVAGLDALNGSPVLDIKSSDTSIFEKNRI